MKRTKLICVAGARPNFMKVAPLWRLLSCDRHFACVLVHTGQHYDEQLSGQFFRDLALPEPHHYLGVGSGSHAQQTAEVMRRFDWTTLHVYPLNEAGANHGSLLGTRGWVP